VAGFEDKRHELRDAGGRKVIGIVTRADANGIREFTVEPGECWGRLADWDAVVALAQGVRADLESA
jgi:hypothetical protein